MLFVKACHNAFLYVLLLCETDNLFIYVFPCFNTDGVVYIWKNHNIFFSRVFMKFNICTYFIDILSLSVNGISNTQKYLLELYILWDNLLILAEDLTDFYRFQC